jgi:tagaturonate reductase
MKMRNIPTFIRYSQWFGKTPDRMARGFAAYLLFMKSEKIDGHYYGRRQADLYLIRDDAAEYFCEVWKSAEITSVVRRVSGNTGLWETDLTQIPKFVQTVSDHLADLARR